MSAPFRIPSSHRSQLDLVGGRVLRGSIVDLDDLGCRHVVEVTADGLPIGLMRADRFDEALAAALIGDACYGFLFELPEAVLASADLVEVRLANTARPVGRGIALGDDRDLDPAILASGSVAWAGGLILDGRLRPGATGEVLVKALVDGHVVAETTARDWTHVRLGNTFGSARAFRLHLPERLADGRVRRIEVVAGDATPLIGSPCVQVAFRDGLVRFIDGLADLRSERIRAETFDALMPQSVPFDAVQRWRRQFAAPLPAAAPRPGSIGVVLVGPGDLDATLASLKGQAGPRWSAAALPDGAGLGFRPDDLREFLVGDGADCDLLVFAAAGTCFDPGALHRLADALDAAPTARSVYCDRLIEAEGQLWPLLLPAFDYERCIEQGYCAELFAMRRAAVLDGLAAGADCLYRLFNAQFDRADEADTAVLHCPQLLGRIAESPAGALAEDLLRATKAHLAERGIEAVVTPGRTASLPSVRVSRRPLEACLSVVVPSGFDPERLMSSLCLLRDTPRFADLDIVVANQCAHDPLRARLDAACFEAVRIVQAPGDGNPARAVNRAVEAASGTLLLLLAGGFESASPGWLDEMLGRLQEPEVGAVGPALVWPSGVVRSAGYVLGPDLSAVPAFGDRIAGEAGYGGLLEAAHQCGAVGADALLTRRALYRSVGGLDETHVPMHFADVDYCLRLRERGLRIVVTPHAALRGPGPRRTTGSPDEGARRARETRNLRHRWGEALLSDPCYNPNLSLDRQPFSGLAWPPRPQTVRIAGRPAARPIPLGL